MQSSQASGRRRTAHSTAVSHCGGSSARARALWLSSTRTARATVTDVFGGSTLRAAQASQPAWRDLLVSWALRCRPNVSQLGQLWDRLAQLGGALLIFDNAESVGELRGYLPPAGTADILITSLNPDWSQLADVVAVDVLSAADARRLLRAGMGEADDEVETELITALGRLPLAMSQASAYIAQTGMHPAYYLQLFRRRRRQLLQRGVPDDHRGTIETTWLLAHAELSVSHPAAVQLLAMCSMLGPEKIPLDLTTAGADLLPDELAAAIRDELDFEDAIRQLRRYSLMSRDGHTVQVHCLVQAVVADSMTAGEADTWLKRAAAALQAAAPHGVASRDTWPRWESLIPHIREIARVASRHPSIPPLSPRASSISPGMRQAICPLGRSSLMPWL
jgi:hypothetical protein